MSSTARREGRARTRAIWAARAVVVSAIGAAAVGCSNSDDPAPPESSESTQAPTTETPAVCSHESNGVCPEECTIDQDRDCCTEHAAESVMRSCSFVVQDGPSQCQCSTAVEGPIPPPAVSARMGSSVEADFAPRPRRA